MTRCATCRNELGEYAERICMGSDLKLCERCIVRENYIMEQQSKHNLIGNGRTIGVEIECNPTLEGLAKNMDFNCEIKRDGSLRGFSAEFVSPILSESTYANWLSEICDNLKGSKLYDRCGLHIWIGTKDYSWSEMQSLLQYCIKWQHIICKMVSPSRHLITGRNTSGRPSIIPNVSIAETKLGFLKALYGTTRLHSGNKTSRMVDSKRANDQGQAPYDGPINRYWWMNIHGHWHRRAIEIRLHHGTVDYLKIYRWIRVWLNLVDKITIEQNIYKSPLELLPPDLAIYYGKKIAENEKTAIEYGIEGFPWSGPKFNYVRNMLTANGAIRPARRENPFLGIDGAIPHPAEPNRFRNIPIWENLINTTQYQPNEIQIEEDEEEPF